MDNKKEIAVNSLVRHKKLSSLGIGCVSKVLKNTVKVNFGTDDVIGVKPSLLTQVDTSKCKTIKFDELKRLSISNSPKLPPYVIIGNELKHWVGIGWVSHGVVTAEQLLKYPRVID